MNSSPFVSIVITTYNSSSTIEETLDSVMNQSYLNFELLIYDDNSTDGTVDFIINYFALKNLKPTIFPSNINSGGPATGRNWGINISKGQYVCFLDADDIWMSNKLEDQLRTIRHKKADVLATNAKVLNGSSFKAYSGSLSIYNQVWRNKLILSSSIVRKEFVLKYKLFFNENKDYISVEDYDFFLNIMLKGGKIFIIKDQLIYYRVIQSSISHVDLKSNELKRLMVLKRLKVRSIKLRIFIHFTYIVYNMHLKIWNLKY